MAKKDILNTLYKAVTRGSKQPLVAWTETLILAIIGAVLWCIAYDIIDEQTVEEMIISTSQKQQFFWPLIFVLLVALRYGFTHGFVCALTCILMSIGYFKYFQILDAFSFYKAVGLLIAAMISGEFRDAWEERLHRNDLDFTFMQRKLDLFTQNYFTLRSSHDQLEQRMAGQVVSLRSNISELEKISERYPIVGVDQHTRLENMASSVLTLFAQIVGIEVAGFYAINEKEKIETKALYTLGSMQEIDLDDPMLKDMLEYKVLLSPANAQNDEHNSKYQLCIPLKDSSDKLIACVVASQVKFFTLTDQNLAILNLVVNYAADMISSSVIAPVIQTEEKHTFLKYLHFVFTQSTLHREQSSIIFCKGKTKQALEIFDKTISTRRGADIYWRRINTDGEEVLVVLLPLTTLIQAQMYRDRVKNQLRLNKIAEDEFEMTEPLDVGIGNELLNEELRKLGLTENDINKCTKYN